MGSGTRSTISLPGKYFLTPTTLADGTPAYILLDNVGRPITKIEADDDHGEIQGLLIDHYRNLHVTHPKGLNTMCVTSPGVIYANGTNALCIAIPEEASHEIEVMNIYLSSDSAGSFYLVKGNQGRVPGETTAYTFDLVGLAGDGVTDTSDVVWAAFLAAQGRGTVGGQFHSDLGLDNELYLIAPNVDYNLVVMWMHEEP